MSENFSIEVVKINKVTIGKHNVALSTISHIDVFESLTQPGITGYIHIKDYQGLQEIGSVFAGDDVKISLDVVGDKSKEITMSFKVYTNEGSKQLNLNTYDYLQLGFCSPWIIDGLVKNVSKAYSNKLISDIVGDLLKNECGASIGYIEPTLQKLETFVSPYWTPYHIIKHLLGFAMNQSKQAGYVCWTDMRSGKVNVTTLDYMLQGNLGTYETFIVNSANPRYSGRVKNMMIESNYNTVRQVNTGLPNTKFHSFNFDKMKIVTTKNDASKTGITRLSKYFPMNSKYIGDSYISHVYTPLFPQTAESIGSDDTKLEYLIEGQEKNFYNMLSVDTIKINIETLGEMNRRVGWLAELDYPSAGVNSNDLTGHPQYKGTYLIREIRHTFSLMSDYNQYITLVSDGFKEFKNADIVTWI